jgi:tetratricopeptide (TPR) repeat protein
MLVEKSLVQTTPQGRYGMHELLRQFAAEKLVQTPDAGAAARHRHSQFYLGFLKSRQGWLVGREQRAAVATVAEEIDNVIAAWRWAAVHNHLDAIEPAIHALYTFYQIRSRFGEGEALFTWTIDQWQHNGAAKEHPHYALVLAKLLARCGALRSELHKFEAAQDRLQAALALSARSYDQGERAFTLTALGLIAVNRDERAVAEEHLHTSLAISRDIGDLNGVVIALIGLASAASQLGDFGPARELAREALAISRQLGRPDLIARALGTLAWSANCLGAYRESQACREESLALYREIGDPMGEAIAVNFLGWDAWCQGGAELETAIARHEEALISYRALGNRAMLAMCLGDLALATVEQGDSERAMQYAREGLAIARDVNLVHFIGYTLSSWGSLTAS